MAKKLKKTPTRGADMARKIWLAGVGAYGRAFTGAQESIAKMSGETSRMFDELVAKGEKIEETVETRGRELAEQVKAQSISIDDRIKQMRARLLAYDEDRDDRLASVEVRLAAVEKKLGRLLGEGKAKKAKKATKKKTTKKKAAAKKKSS